MKRRVPTILLCLALGAILNPLVACTMTLIQGPPATGSTAYLNLAHDRGEPLKATEIDVMQEILNRSFFTTTPADPWASPAQSPFDPPLYEHPSAVASGWPFASFAATWIDHGNIGGFQCTRGVAWPPTWVRPRDPADPGAGVTVIPYGVVWPGLVANTCAYSATLWFWLGLPSLIRTRRRRRRHQCVRCAYPRENHAVCPECGTTHKRGMREPIAHALPPD